jgi:polo-like kinase 1
MPSSSKVKYQLSETVEDCSTSRSSGSTYVKKYKTGRFLGKGGFARCYEFTSFDSGRTYAAKVIPKASLKRSSARKKLLNEIKIHRSLSHTHVVKFEHFFEDKDNVYILLELCDNQTLMELVRRRGRLTEP